MMATLTKTILLINDDPHIQEIMEEYLSHFSEWKVKSSRYASVALESAIQDKPDAILFDLSAYGMTFFTFLKRLRSQPETQNIPVILTGIAVKWFDLETIKDCQVAGVIDYYKHSLDFPQQIATLLNWDKPAV